MALDLGPDVDPALDEAPPADHPAPLRQPWTATRITLAALAVLAVVATWWAWGRVGMSLTAITEGLGDIWNLLGRMLPPRIVDLPRLIGLAAETFFMALLGTLLATMLSIPLAFLAAGNTTPTPLVSPVARGLIVVTRAIPDIIFALIFVRAVGIGPLPGILALGLHSIGMLGKLFADAVEQIDDGPRDAVLATGATRMQSLTTAVVPQVLPSFIGAALYRLDINLRISVVLGLVGAGGIGFELQSALRSLVYDRGMGIVVVIMVMVVVVEFLSAAIRQNIIGGEAAIDPTKPVGVGARLLDRARSVRRAAAPEPQPVADGGAARLSPPWTRQRRMKAGYLGLFAVLIAAAFLTVDFTPLELVTAIPDVWETSTRLFPPDFSTARQGLIDGMIETIAIGVLATALGLGLMLPFAFLSARNVAPNKGVYYAARTFLVVIRSVPELILAIIFVAAMGLGPVPGVFALAIGTVGFIAKLFADSIEEVQPGPRDAVFATGATRVQETATSVIPQAMPAFVANALYALDINIRASTILGIVGGGGIGFLLSNSVKTMNFQTTSAIIISLFAVVYVIELVAAWIRSRII